MTRALPLPQARLLNEREAAAYCGVSVNTFKAHVRVRPVKIGSCVRYDVRALDKWADGHGQIAKTMNGDDWLDLLDEDQGARN